MAADQRPSHSGVLPLAQEFGGLINTGSRKTDLVSCSRPAEHGRQKTPSMDVRDHVASVGGDTSMERSKGVTSRRRPRQRFR